MLSLFPTRVCVYMAACVHEYIYIYASPSIGHQLELEKLAQLENVNLEKQTMKSTHNFYTMLHTEPFI